MFRSTLVQWRSYAHYRMRRILSGTKGLESVGRILLRGLERRFMGCFHMWRTAVHDYRVAWKTLCRIANAVLSSAFRHWHKYAVEFKERISKLPRLLIRAALSQMLSTFKLWHQAVGDCRLAWKTLCRIAHAVLSSGFRRWSKVTSSLAEKARASKEIMLYIKRGLSALRRSALLKWKQSVFEQTKLLDAQRHAATSITLYVKRGLGSLAGSALRRWKSFVFHGNAQASAANRLALYMKRGRLSTLKSTFYRWQCSATLVRMQIQVGPPTTDHKIVLKAHATAILRVYANKSFDDMRLLRRFALWATWVKALRIWEVHTQHELSAVQKRFGAVSVTKIILDVVPRQILRHLFHAFECWRLHVWSPYPIKPGSGDDRMPLFSGTYLRQCEEHGIPGEELEALADRFIQVTTPAMFKR